MEFEISLGASGAVVTRGWCDGWRGSVTITVTIFQKTHPSHRDIYTLHFSPKPAPYSISWQMWQHISQSPGWLRLTLQPNTERSIKSQALFWSGCEGSFNLSELFKFITEKKCTMTLFWITVYSSQIAIGFMWLFSVYRPDCVYSQRVINNLVNSILYCLNN